MIDGLKIHVSSEEIRGHLEKRAGYHRDKASFYAKQASQLREGGVGTTGHSNDPVGSLQSSQRSHEEKSAFFAFMAEHVIPNDTYQLSENDLTRLEFVSRYF